MRSRMIVGLVILVSMFSFACASKGATGEAEGIQLITVSSSSNVDAYIDFGDGPQSLPATIEVSVDSGVTELEWVLDLTVEDEQSFDLVWDRDGDEFARDRVDVTFEGGEMRVDVNPIAMSEETQQAETFHDWE